MRISVVSLIACLASANVAFADFGLSKAQNAAMGAMVDTMAEDARSLYPHIPAGVAGVRMAVCVAKSTTKAEAKVIADGRDASYAFRPDVLRLVKQVQARPKTAVCMKETVDI